VHVPADLKETDVDCLHLDINRATITCTRACNQLERKKLIRIFIVFANSFTSKAFLAEFLLRVQLGRLTISINKDMMGNYFASNFSAGSVQYSYPLRAYSSFLMVWKIFRHFRNNP
jgi:hypothetical protein